MCSLAEAYTGQCFATPSPAHAQMLGGGSPMAMGPPPTSVPPYMSPQAPVQALQPMGQPASPCDKSRYHCSQCPDCQGFFTSILNGSANPKNGAARPMGGKPSTGIWDWLKEHDKTVLIAVLVAIVLILGLKQWRAKRMQQAAMGMGGRGF